MRVCRDARGDDEVNLPQTGRGPQKVAFFREVAQAFEFLAVFHSLSAEDQLSLMQLMTKLQGKAK